MSDRSVWLERRVIAYAHQGGAWEAPSSTLHAIEHALDAGATAIELDVHATVDGGVVADDELSVGRGVHVQLDRRGAGIQRVLDRVQRRRRRLPGAALVRVGDDAAFQPCRPLAPNAHHD